MEPKPILPTPRPSMPPPTTLKEEVIVIPDDGAVKEEPTEGDDKTEDQRVVVAKTPKAEFKIDIDAAWSCSDDAYDNPDREVHELCPFMVYLQVKFCRRGLGSHLSDDACCWSVCPNLAFTASSVMSLAR